MPKKPAAAKPRVLKADKKLNEQVLSWKTAHNTVKLAEHERDLAKSPVRRAFDEHSVDVIDSACGTLVLQRPADELAIDWKALAEAHLSPKVIKKALPTFTTSKPKAPVLAALGTWSAELGLK